VYGYELETGQSMFDTRQRRKDFSSSLCVQTGSGAHPASVRWVPRILSPGLKRSRGVTLTTHPHLVLRSSMRRSYNSSPQSAFMVFSATALAFKCSIGISKFLFYHSFTKLVFKTMAIRFQTNNMRLMK
jgi:hypothetical protein